MRIEMNGLGNYKEPTPLNGWYDFLCTEAKINDKTGSLQLSLTVTDGPDFEDGSSPIDRKLTHFVTIDLSKIKPSGVNFVMGLLVKCCQAFDVEIDKSNGFDIDDFVGKTATGKVKPTENDGTVQENIKAWKIA